MSEDPADAAALELATPIALFQHLARLRSYDHTIADSRRISKDLSKHWHAFQAWVSDSHWASGPLVISTIADFISWEFGRFRRRGALRAARHIRRALAAIRFGYFLKREASNFTDMIEPPEGFPEGCIAFNGVPFARGEGVTLQDLVFIMMRLDDSLIARRDRALLALGWAGALRSSELAGLAWSDVAMAGSSLMLRVGSGRLLRIPTAVNQPAVCPVFAMRQWRQHCHRSDLFVFHRLESSSGEKTGRLPAEDVEAILQFRATVAGITTRFASDALRMGWTMTAAGAGRVLASTCMHLGAPVGDTSAVAHANVGLY